MSSHAQQRVPQLWLTLWGYPACLKNQLAVSEESFRKQQALQWRAWHSLGTKNRALLIKEADVKPIAGRRGDDVWREDMWYSFSRRKATAKKCARLISATFPALELLGTRKPNCLGVFLHTHTPHEHTPYQTQPPTFGEEQISKPSTKDKSSVGRSAYLRAGLVLAQKLPPSPTPKQACSQSVQNRDGPHSSRGKCMQIGNIYILPHIYLLSSFLLAVVWLLHSLLVLESLTFQQPLWFKRLRAAQPLVPMLQHSNITQGKGQNGNPLQVRIAANPQSLPCIAPVLVTAIALVPVHMPRAILTAFCLVSTLVSRCLSS